MIIFLHIAFISMILFSIWLVYGAWFKDFGERHYDGTKRDFPPFLLWPKDLSTYVKIYKAQSNFILLFVIALYILYLKFSYFNIK
jgi:hypothetical protein